MMEMFSFEMGQLIEQLEQNIIQSESGYSMDQINEIFRIMHTIKGSAAMMLFDNISTTAHSVEDLFFYLREENPQNVDYHRLTDLVLAGMDFIKVELNKAEAGQTLDGDGSAIIASIKQFLAEIKGEAAPEPLAQEEAPAAHYYKAIVFYEDGCEMENIRAFTLLQNLNKSAAVISHEPADVINEESVEAIRKKGFTLLFSSSQPYAEIYKHLASTVYLKKLLLEELESRQAEVKAPKSYSVKIKFNEDSEMENVRAYALIHRLNEVLEGVEHLPVDLMDDASLEIVRHEGLRINIETVKPKSELLDILESTVYLKELEVEELKSEGDSLNEPDPEVAPAHENAPNADSAPNEAAPAEEKGEEPQKIQAPPAQQHKADDPLAQKKAPTQHVISVNVSKLDQLLNLMGELVISEAMVTQNPELENLELESFHKEARQLRKIIKDLQETVMSMRMVPLSTTFFKMHRIVRDMCRQLGKDVQFEVIGEDTEVDKNIIEHISDPLMHIIRNSVDHGIEMPDVRVASGKSEKGSVTLEAKNSGGDVLIIVKDDGKGLDREKILKKAKNNGLLKKPESEYSDKEVQQFIFLPGFSTNEQVTSYSGRGVGMDVVSTNLEIVGGSVIVDSVPGQGSAFTLKIPLTLAIIDGMTVKMGGAKYTIPIVSIKQSFKASGKDIFTDPNGNEMISTRGEIYNVVRLHEFFGVETAVKNIEEGILIMLENGDQTICLLADELVGEQQVVVKSIPKYFKKTRGISGCTLLGNGDISLIIDVAGFFDK
jgi:two-component system chemotaxis sensor kinase CheA